MKCDIDRAFGNSPLAGNTGCTNSASKKIKLLDKRVIDVCDNCIDLYSSALQFEIVDQKISSNDLN